jgi:hypothetical protein
VEIPEALKGYVDPETFGRADPYTRDLAIKLATEKAEIAAKLEQQGQLAAQQTAQMTALQQQVNQLTETTTQAQSNGDANTLANYSDDQLRGVRDKIEANTTAAMAALATDPTDEAARAALAEAQGQMALRRQVEDELQTRAITGAVGDLRGELGQSNALEQMQQRFGQELLVKYGADALNPDSPLHQRATQIGETWSADNDLSTAQGISLMAARMAFAEAAEQIKKEQAELEPDLNDEARRQLAILGAGERGTALANQTAALRQKGDVKSKGQASRMEINAVIAKLTGGQAPQ